MYDVTLKNRVKGINWNTAVFMGLFHLGVVAALFVFNWKAMLVAILLAGTTTIMLTRLPRAMDLPGTKSMSTGGEFALCSFWGL